MKKIHLLLMLILVTCSLGLYAQEDDYQDDPYLDQEEATEYVAPEEAEEEFQQQEEIMDPTSEGPILDDPSVESEEY